jgi:hypothetical protein
MGSTIYHESLDTVLRPLLDTESVLVVTPDTAVLGALVELLPLDGVSVRVLADEGALDAALSDFRTASRLADHVAAGTVTLRTTALDGHPLVVTDDIYALVTVDGHAAALRADEAAFVTAATDTYEAAWESATDFTLPTPPLSELVETLDSDVGTAVSEAFEAALAATDSLGTDDDPLDAVTLCLLLAARHDIQLYTISQWGEGVGLASKATFSRTKTALEEAGLLTTEKDPIDVGRPRLRLRLADDALRNATSDAFVATARDRLD